MNHLDLKIISKDKYKSWFNQHHAALSRCSPFHYPQWLEIVEEGLSFKAVFIGIWQGNDLVAVMPGFLTRRGPFRLFGSPLPGTMTSYLGPVGLAQANSDDTLPDLLSACFQFVRLQWRVEYVEFTLRDPSAANRSASGTGWEYTQPGSYTLDLRSAEEALWAKLKVRCRRHIRKDQRLGVEIVPLSDATTYYEILDETFARHRTTGWHPKRFFQGVIETLVPLNLLWAWGAKYEGQIIAAGLFLHDNQEIHYLSGASRSQYRSIPTSYLLHWHAIVSAKRAGISVYDFGGRGRIASINHFKESFNPEAVTFCSFNWAPSHVRYAKRGYLSVQPYLQRFRRWLSVT